MSITKNHESHYVAVLDNPLLYAAQQHFILWLPEHSVAGFCGIAFPLPINILIVGGCFSLACLQSSQLILFASCFFIPLLQ